MGTSDIPDLSEIPERVQNDIRSGNLHVLPGMRLWRADSQYASGDGTYVDNGYLYSSLVGALKCTSIENDKFYVEVVPLGGGAALARVGDVVTAVVARVTARGARCELRCAGPRPLSRPLRAQLLKENVTDVNKDRVDMHKSFRPGDVILAKVLPVTSLQFYDLTTAEPELGVVIAHASEAPPGVNMVPLSWNEMQCPVTLVREHRKVARVVPENIYEIMGESSTHRTQQLLQLTQNNPSAIF